MDLDGNPATWLPSIVEMLEQIGYLVKASYLNHILTLWTNIWDSMHYKFTIPSDLLGFYKYLEQKTLDCSRQTYEVVDCLNLSATIHHHMKCYVATTKIRLAFF